VVSFFRVFQLKVFHAQTIHRKHVHFFHGFTAYLIKTDEKATDSWSKVFNDFLLFLVLCEYIYDTSVQVKSIGFWNIFRHCIRCLCITVVLRCGGKTCMHHVYYRKHPPPHHPPSHVMERWHKFFLTTSPINFIIKRFSVFVTNRQNRSLWGPLSATLANRSICIGK
jgi:hypothetical protein